MPLGLGAAYLFHLGRLPANMRVRGHHNVVKPDDGANWQLRAQVQLTFPKQQDKRPRRHPHRRLIRTLSP